MVKLHYANLAKTRLHEFEKLISGHKI